MDGWMLHVANTLFSLCFKTTYVSVRFERSRSCQWNDVNRLQSYLLGSEKPRVPMELDMVCVSREGGQAHVTRAASANHVSPPSLTALVESLQKVFSGLS